MQKLHGIDWDDCLRKSSLQYKGICKICKIKTMKELMLCHTLNWISSNHWHSTVIWTSSPLLCLKSFGLWKKSADTNSYVFLSVIEKHQKWTILKLKVFHVVCDRKQIAVLMTLIIHQMFFMYVMNDWTVQY